MAYLNPRFGQINFHRHFFACENIRIPGLDEQRLKDVELGAGECGAFPSLFARIDTCIISGAKGEKIVSFVIDEKEFIKQIKYNIYAQSHISHTFNNYRENTKIYTFKLGTDK